MGKEKRERRHQLIVSQVHLWPSSETTGTDVLA